MAGPALTYNTSTTGTDFTISSIGNTATWNLPNASATARGVVSTAAQTFAGLKTFNNGASVVGVTGSTSNLTLRVTSATIPAAASDRYLTVNAAGNVTLNALPPTFAPKTFTEAVDQAPVKINAGNSALLTFTIAGANLSTNSTVHVSPIKTLGAGTSINWARVTSPTTITMAVSAIGANQKFNPGNGNDATFNITVIEF